MLEFIVNNYYVILIVCILLIFAIIGYIVDTLKSRKYEETNENDTYVPEEEVFIQKFEEPINEEDVVENENVEELIDEYNKVQNDENSI